MIHVRLCVEKNTKKVVKNRQQYSIPGILGGKKCDVIVVGINFPRQRPFGLFFSIFLLLMYPLVWLWYDFFIMFLKKIFNKLYSIRILPILGKEKNIYLVCSDFFTCNQYKKHQEMYLLVVE